MTTGQRNLAWSSADDLARGITAVRPAFIPLSRRISVTGAIGKTLAGLALMPIFKQNTAPSGVAERGDLCHNRDKSGSC